MFIFIVILLSVACLVHGSPLIEDFHRELTADQVDRLNNWSSNDHQNVWELSGQYQGDILVNPKARNVLEDYATRWDNKELIYEFDTKINEYYRQHIKRIISKISEKTCIIIRQKRPTDQNWIHITNKNQGCYSYVGKQVRGAQILNLQESICMTEEAILHEFMHALGFEHQHNSADRDRYITILWDNIQETQKYQFDKNGANHLTNFGNKYDFDSIMHSSGYAFSKTGGITMKKKTDGYHTSLKINTELSPIDISKINVMYDCKELYKGLYKGGPPTA